MGKYFFIMNYIKDKGKIKAIEMRVAGRLTLGNVKMRILYILIFIILTISCTNKNPTRNISDLKSVDYETNGILRNQIRKTYTILNCNYGGFFSKGDTTEIYIYDERGRLISNRQLSMDNPTHIYKYDSLGFCISDKYSTDFVMEIDYEYYYNSNENILIKRAIENNLVFDSTVVYYNSYLRPIKEIGSSRFRTTYVKNYNYTDSILMGEDLVYKCDSNCMILHKSLGISPIVESVVEYKIDFDQIINKQSTDFYSDSTIDQTTEYYSEGILDSSISIFGKQMDTVKYLFIHEK